MTKLVCVVASRSQGEPVIKSLLDAKFKVRALVRNPDSDHSKELLSKGVQVVKCDISSDSKEEIKKALDNSEIFFLVTLMGENEEECGKKAVDAAFEAKIGHLIFSSLPGASKISNGRVKVPHFDSKSNIELYAREISKKNPQFITSFVLAPFYYQNFTTYFVPQKDSDGKSYSVSLPIDPQSKYPLEMGDVNNMGPIVLGIILNPTKYSAQSIAFSGGSYTGEEIVSAFSKSSGKTVKFNYVPSEVFGKFPFPLAHEISVMFDYYNQYGAFTNYNKDLAKELTHLTTLEEYLENNPIKLN